MSDDPHTATPAATEEAMATRARLLRLFSEREHGLDQLVAFEAEHEAILNQQAEMRAALVAIDDEIRTIAATGEESQLVCGRTTVTVRRKAAPKSYDAELLLETWPALEESHPELFSRRIDSRALQALVKKGEVPEAVAETALRFGKAPAPSVAIETAAARDAEP